MPRTKRRESTHPITLRHVQPAKGRYRHYRLAPCESLFGEPSLLITWGRIGNPMRVRLETFTSRAARRARWGELVERRRAHGYQEYPA